MIRALQKQCLRARPVAQSWPTLCGPIDCSSPGSSVHGISQTGILERVATSSSRTEKILRLKEMEDSGWQECHFKRNAHGYLRKWYWAEFKEGRSEPKGASERILWDGSVWCAGYKEWWLILCVNWTGPRDAQITGKMSFLRVSECFKKTWKKRTEKDTFPLSHLLLP